MMKSVFLSFRPQHIHNKPQLFTHFLCLDKKAVFLLAILLSFFFPRFAQAQYQISGQVQEQGKQTPLTGASIYLQGTNRATASDAEGKFTLENIPKGEYKLVVSYVGFQKYEQAVEVNRDLNLAITLASSPFVADEVVVSATRVSEEIPLAFTNVSKAEIEKQNLGQDLPILLNFTPSVVSTSDAGAGVGYTNIRIRGSDATRVNVTINGIPLNDAESQGAFWVNLPDFASSVANIQVQRGVGTSTNGAGAFGASINIQTNQRREDPYAELSNTYGSFNTWKHTLQAGTGLIKDHFTVDARLSKISSDGFIDRAFSDLKSFYLSGAYYGEKSLIKANIFSGREQTFQAWYGVPEARLEGDVEGMLAYIDRNFLNAEQATNLLNSDSRTYNSQLYENETDNYQQDHYQFFYTYEFNKHWNLNTALHYTRGRGYFEQYRYQDALSTYSIDPVEIGDSVINNSDLIRRLWLDNDFYGTIFSLNHRPDRWDLTLGGGWNRYEGKHFGEVIWARFAGESEIRDRYYENDATKSDFNIYGKALYDINAKLHAFVDLQYRRVNYSFEGLAVDDILGSRPVQQEVRLNFFNPKFGFTYDLQSQASLYASLSVANKEPNRNDYVQSTVNSRPRPERLYDIEVGYRRQSKQWSFNANAYAMIYEDQLVLTGAVNDVGQFTRTNVDNSYRLGIELVSNWQILSNLSWNFNATISTNQIKDFREFVDFLGATDPLERTEQLAELNAQGFVLDEGTGQLVRDLGTTDIAFSPELILGSQLEYQPFQNFSVALLSKYVGEQFLDNTASEARQLDAFLTQDIRLIYHLRTKVIPEIGFKLLVNNILDEKYESNGYTFGYFLGTDRISENFYFPQAGTNFLVALEIKF